MRLSLSYQEKDNQNLRKRPLFELKIIFLLSNKWSAFLHKKMEMQNLRTFSYYY